MNEPLRPLTLGEILDRTAQLYRARFLLFLGISVIPPEWSWRWLVWSAWLWRGGARPALARYRRQRDIFLWRY
ncbi:MAG: hypothetical protein ABR990_14305, partial [Terracidiphilus sp.]